MDTVIQLFKSILGISLFASAMIIIVLLIRAIAKNRVNINIASFLWLLVILRLCLPGMLESPVHIDGLFPGEEATIEQSALSNFSPTYEEDIDINNAPNLTLPDKELVSLENDGVSNGLYVSDSNDITFWDKAANFIQSLDLWGVASIIWIAGSLIVLLLAIKESIVFGLHIKKNSELIKNQAILDIINAHKAANRIKRTIRVSACPSIQMPMMIGVFNPHILLPAYMIDKFERKYLDPILLHEVCHIKRNDILKSYLYIMAKALHWFNPLVWVGIKKMKEDMEFACDQHVLRLLGKKQGIEYCESLIQATRFLKAIRIPQFASSLCEKKSNLKERVIKMINPQKKSKKAATISLVLAMVMVITCFTTACQPTPEEDVVIGKGDGLSDLIQSTPDTSGSVSPSSTSKQTNDVLYTKLEAPKHWSLETTALGDKLNITADVDIELPGVSQLPAATASLSEFTQEDLDKIAQVIGVDGAIWTERSSITKENLEQSIIETKAWIAELEAGDEPDAAAMIKKEKEWLESAEQMFIDAPYKSELKKLDFKIDVMDSNEDQSHIGFEGTTQVDDQPFYFLAINAYSSDVVNRVYANYGSNLVWFGGVNIDAPYGVSLTKEQAAAQASEIAKQLTDELSLCYITPAASGQDDVSRNWGWACVFMREINGCPTAYETARRPSGLEAVNVPVDYEKMIIVMDDTGMVSFIWDIPLTIESIDNPDVSLASFDEISQRAIEQVAQREADMVGEKIDDRTGIDWGDPGCTADIVKVELGLMRVDKVNSNDYYYIPVWKFFVNVIHTDEYYERMGIEPRKPVSVADIEFRIENGYSININGEYSLGYDVITLNALDSSTIDSDLGF